MPHLYLFAIENVETTYPEFEPLYRQHYAEMQTRLAEQNIPIADFKPRLTQYFASARDGWFVHYTVRLDGQPVGYGNIYLTSDMHNGELIAQEDTLYILPEHRNGVGKRLVRFALDDLRQRGVKRLNVTAVTDLRVAKLWERMGFRHAAHAMTYVFR